MTSRKRIFVVGCARSGTTLVQQLLAAHAELTSFPETHFFTRTVPVKKWRRRLFVVQQTHLNHLRSYLRDLNLSHLYKPFRGRPLNLSAWSKYLIDILDAIADEQGTGDWLEKTPKHLYYIDLISSVVPETMFIHVIRDPVATIAALKDASQRYPEYFHQETVEKATSRYRRDVAESSRYQGQTNHYFVHYEDIVANTNASQRALLEWLGLDADNITDHASVPDLIISQEEWKLQNRGPIRAMDKIKERLTESEIQQLRDTVSRWDYPLLNAYRS